MQKYTKNMNKKNRTKQNAKIVLKSLKQVFNFLSTTFSYNGF